MRLSATKSLLERKDTVIVANGVLHLRYRQPRRLPRMILHVREKERMPQRDVIARLAAMQYERNELEFKRGTFACGGCPRRVPRRELRDGSAHRASRRRGRELTLFDPLTGHASQRVPRLHRLPVEPLCDAPGDDLARDRGIKIELA